MGNRVACKLHVFPVRKYQYVSGKQMGEEQGEDVLLHERIAKGIANRVVLLVQDEGRARVLSSLINLEIYTINSSLASSIKTAQGEEKKRRSRARPRTSACGTKKQRPRHEENHHCETEKRNEYIISNINADLEPPAPRGDGEDDASRTKFAQSRLS